MKKLSMILLLALLVGVAMAKPPTKQEKQAQKQAEIAAVLDVIKQGRFIIYEPNYSTYLPGEKAIITCVDFPDTTHSELIYVNETDKLFEIKYLSKKISNEPRQCKLFYYKKNGYIKFVYNEHNGSAMDKAQYTDVVKLVD